MILAKRAMKALNSCAKELKERHPSQEEYQKYFQVLIQMIFSRARRENDKYGREQVTLSEILKFLSNRKSERAGSVIV